MSLSPRYFSTTPYQSSPHPNSFSSERETEGTDGLSLLGGAGVAEDQTASFEQPFTETDDEGVSFPDGERVQSSTLSMDDAKGASRSGLSVVELSAARQRILSSKFAHLFQGLHVLHANVVSVRSKEQSSLQARSVTRKHIEKTWEVGGTITTLDETIQDKDAKIEAAHHM